MATPADNQGVLDTTNFANKPLIIGNSVDEDEFIVIPSTMIQQEVVAVASSAAGGKVNNKSAIPSVHGRQ